MQFLSCQRGEAGKLRERIHQATVEGKLLFGVSVILVGGCRLRRAQAKGIHSVTLIYFYVQKIWAALEQQFRQASHPGRSCERLEWSLVGRVERIGISCEVVIEGNILIKDHHQMLDWGRSRAAHVAGSLGLCDGRHQTSGHCPSQGRSQASY